MPQPRRFPATGRLFRPRAAAPELPPRVAERIAEHEAVSEIMVSWAQLGLVIVLGAAWFLGVEDRLVDPASRAMPWILAAYLAFTVTRLQLAHRRRLGEALRWASIACDLGLLVALVWSVQAQQAPPGASAVHAPAFSYVFVLIALRALNFTFGKVIAAGVAALAVWALLSGTVMPHAQAPGLRGALASLRAAGTLLGGEVDRLFAIIGVTGVLGLAIRRNRRLLTLAVTASDASRALARFVPPEVAAYVSGADESVRVGTAETIEATVLFLDLEEFTALSERLDPVRLVQTLNAFYAAVAEPLARHGGVIHQFQGDAILATFNAPRADADHAASAVRAAIEIQNVLQSRTFEDAGSLHARIGINTGGVLHGMIGTPDRLGYTVVGDEVNVAARLEALNKQCGTAVLVSESTRVAAGATRFAFRRVDEVRLRGRSGTTEIYTVDAADRRAIRDAGGRGDDA